MKHIILGSGIVLTAGGGALIAASVDLAGWAFFAGIIFVCIAVYMEHKNPG